MTRYILGGLILGGAAIVLNTRRIGFEDWRLWVIFALLGCAEALGAMA